MISLRGIQGRLIVILAAGVLAIGAASLIAILALRDLGRSFEAVSRHEVPSMVAGLDLARFAATIEGRGPSLIAAENEWARYRQATLLEQDFRFLDEALVRFKRDPPGRAAGEIAEIDIQVTAIRATLDEMKVLLSELASRQRLQRVALGRITRAQENLRQSFEPTLLALSRAIGSGSVDRVDRLLTVNSIREPLLQCERLLDASINALLMSADQRTPEDLGTTRGHVERLSRQLSALAAELPVGIRPSFQRALEDLSAGAMGADGLLQGRLDELQSRARLAALVKANQEAGAHLNFRTRRVLEMVRQDVDAANERIAASVASQTSVLILLSLAAMLVASMISYFFVVRDLGHNLHGVTEAMMRLAAGERGVSVPATRRTDELGELARAFSVFRENAVALERVGRELRQKSEHLLITFDNMNDGLSVFDSAGRLVTSNAKFQELYDLPPGALLPGTDLASLLDRFETSGAQAFDATGQPIPIRELLKARTSKARQYEVRTGAGRVVELRSNPTPSGFVTIHTDRTVRRSIEAQLLQAQKMEMVGQLTGGVAHDFNNILAVVTGNLHILREELVSAGLPTDRLDRAMTAVDRATMQIDRMLTFARRQTLHPQPTDVDELISGMIDLVMLSVGSAIDVEQRPCPDLPPLMIDAGQMENALLNLAINARDAMPDGGRLVFATERRSVERRDLLADDLPPGEYVTIEVADTGTGMPADVVAHAVEPFFTTKERGRGSGLGLSMVYGFVRQSGGALRIDSRPGAGTRIVLILPVATTGESPPPLPSPSAPTALTGGGEHVLVVEDSPDLLEVTATLLRRWGYEVTTADRGERALTLLNDTPGVALLLTDIGLKDGMDGTALAREACRRRPGLAVLLTSAHSPDSLSSATAAPEVLDTLPFIGKPAAPERLSQAVRAAIEGRSRLSPPSTTSV